MVPARHLIPDQLLDVAARQVAAHEHVVRKAHILRARLREHVAIVDRVVPGDPGAIGQLQQAGHDAVEAERQGGLRRGEQVLLHVAAVGVGPDDLRQQHMLRDDPVHRVVVVPRDDLEVGDVLDKVPRHASDDASRLAGGDVRQIRLGRDNLAVGHRLELLHVVTAAVHLPLVVVVHPPHGRGAVREVLELEAAVTTLGVVSDVPVRELPDGRVFLVHCHGFSLPLSESLRSRRIVARRMMGLFAFTFCAELVYGTWLSCGACSLVTWPPLPPPPRLPKLRQPESLPKLRQPERLPKLRQPDPCLPPPLPSSFSPSSSNISSSRSPRASTGSGTW